MNSFLVRALLPFGIWFAHFSFVYAAHTALCSTGQPASLHQTIIVLATIVAVVLLVAALTKSVRALGNRADEMASTIATGLALLAVIWTSVPAMFLEACI